MGSALSQARTLTPTPLPMGEGKAGVSVLSLLPPGEGGAQRRMRVRDAVLSLLPPGEGGAQRRMRVRSGTQAMSQSRTPTLTQPLSRRERGFSVRVQPAVPAIACDQSPMSAAIRNTAANTALVAASTRANPAASLLR